MVDMEDFSQIKPHVVDLTTSNYNVQVLKNPQSPYADETPVEECKDVQKTPCVDYERPCGEKTPVEQWQDAQTPVTVWNQTQESPCGGAIMSPSDTTKVAEARINHCLGGPSSFATLRTIPKSWDATSFDSGGDTIIDSPGSSSETFVDPLSPDPNPCVDYTCGKFDFHADPNIDSDGGIYSTSKGNPEEERPPLRRLKAFCFS